MSEVDFRQIADAALAAAHSLLPHWFPAGAWDGARNFKIGGIDGSEGESLVVTVGGSKAGAWKDFAGTDKGSDLISLYAAHRHIEQLEAARAIAEELRIGVPEPAPQRRRPAGGNEDEDRGEWIRSVPADAPRPAFKAPAAWGEAKGRWPYQDLDGSLMFYHVRIEKGDGKKDFRPYTFRSHKDGSRRWRWYWPDMPLPLYGLPRLAEKPDATIVIVEGEKKADAGARLLTSQVVLGWPGGVERAIRGDLDLSVCQGRKVVLWPDADRKLYPDAHPNAGTEMPREEQPGWRAMVAIAEGLRGIAGGVRIVVPPADLPDGWDLADAEEEGWTQEGTLAWMRGHLVDPWAPPAPPEPEPSPEPELYPDHMEEPPRENAAPEQDQGEAPLPDEDDEDAMPLPESHPHFVPLGTEDGRFVYLSKATRQVVSMAAGSHSKLGLLQLAPLVYWEREFAGKDGVRWDAAADHVMRSASAAGTWDSGRIRGRGCWWDRGRLVVHLGNRLIVSGEEMATTEIRSRHVYPAAPQMRGPGRAPLTAKEARRLVEIAKRFSWDMPASAALLCGWIALAPVCGALSWRPHVWITGGSGSGKTTVLEDFIAPLCAGTEIRVQGSSTEAGIRQTLRADARPVIFDESESNDERERGRIQNILALIRQSSSESGAQTYKGTAGGLAQAFHIRSMFCLASINVTIRMQADHTRIAVLGLRSSSSVEPDKRAESWKALESELEALAEDRHLPGRLLARIVSMIPTIRANIKTFIKVAARHFKSQRLGDQYGTLLAGCYALWNDGEASERQAQELIDRFDWSSYTEEADEDESAACLSSILQASVRIDVKGGGLTVTLGELVAAVGGQGGPIAVIDAAHALGRHGLRVKGTDLLVANRCDALARLLRERPWGHGWNNYLRRIKGATPEKPTQFSPGHVSRCTAVPLSAILAE